jgi:hypothetical protein
LDPTEGATGVASGYSSSSSSGSSGYSRGSSKAYIPYELRDAANFAVSTRAKGKGKPLVQFKPATRITGKSAGTKPKVTAKKIKVTHKKG